MNITISARNSSIPQNTKDYAHEKAEKLQKYYRLSKISIVMEVEGDNYIIEMVATPEKGGKAAIANAKASEWFAAIDQANDKMERQLRKLKERVKSHRLKKQKPEGASSKGEEPEETYKDAIDKMED